MNTKKIQHLNNNFIVAMPSLKDSYFDRSVAYVYEHDSKGAMAFVVNKPLTITIGDILRQLNIDIKDDRVDDIPLLLGGPVSQEQVFIIYYNPELQDESNNKSHIILAQPKEILESLAAGENHDNVVVFLGYSGWGEGQLEHEIINNDWLVAPVQENILFNTPFNKRWDASLKIIGIDSSNLSGDIGHA